MNFGTNECTCKTLVCILTSGEKIYKLKKKFKTQDEAIAICKIENAKSHHIHKLVPYRCKSNNTIYHIGRNGNLIKKK